MDLAYKLDRWDDFFGDDPRWGEFVREEAELLIGSLEPKKQLKFLHDNIKNINALRVRLAELVASHEYLVTALKKHEATLLLLLAKYGRLSAREWTTVDMSYGSLPSLARKINACFRDVGLPFDIVLIAGPRPNPSILLNSQRLNEVFGGSFNLGLYKRDINAPHSILLNGAVQPDVLSLSGVKMMPLEPSLQKKFEMVRGLIDDGVYRTLEIGNAAKAHVSINRFLSDHGFDPSDLSVEYEGLQSPEPVKRMPVRGTGSRAYGRGAAVAPSRTTTTLLRDTNPRHVYTFNNPGDRYRLGYVKWDIRWARRRGMSIVTVDTRTLTDLEGNVDEFRIEKILRQFVRRYKYALRI